MIYHSKGAFLHSPLKILLNIGGILFSFTDQPLLFWNSANSVTHSSSSLDMPSWWAAFCDRALSCRLQALHFVTNSGELFPTYIHKRKLNGRLKTHGESSSLRKRKQEAELRDRRETGCNSEVPTRNTRHYMAPHTFPDTGVYNKPLLSTVRLSPT